MARGYDGDNKRVAVIGVLFESCYGRTRKEAEENMRQHICAQVKAHNEYMGGRPIHKFAAEEICLDS